MKEYTQHGRCRIIGWVDNQALQIAVSRGYSAKMAHMETRYGGAHFYFWQQSGVIPHHCSGDENYADIFTKVLGARKLKYLLRVAFGLNVAKNAHGSIVISGQMVRRIVRLLDLEGETFFARGC